MSESKRSLPAPAHESNAKVNWEKIRQEFPSLTRWTFLNTATFGQLPRRVAEAIATHLARRDELACSDFLEWFDDADRIRAAVARLIHCEPCDVAFVPNAATALSLLLAGVDWRPGDRVITLENEFPNNIYYPALLRERGVELVEASWERFRDAVDARTRLVLLSEVNYTNGFRPPLVEVARCARDRGALLFVDGTQSLGALEFDVRAAQPDMFAVHGYKWLLSPNGAGFMYVQPSLRERLQPAVVGWRSHHDWRSVDNLHHGAPVFCSGAEKYEGGMLPFALLYGMEASIGMMLEIGPSAIERRVMELASCVRDTLRRLGARLPFDESPWYDSPVVAARFEGRPASMLARALKSRRVLVSARHDYLRVSPHFYNNEADIERLAGDLGELL